MNHLTTDFRFLALLVSVSGGFQVLDNGVQVCCELQNFVLLSSSADTSAGALLKGALVLIALLRQHG